MGCIHSSKLVEMTRIMTLQCYHFSDKESFGAQLHDSNGNQLLPNVMHYPYAFLIELPI